MAKSVSNLTKTAQVNSFTGGLNTDLHPMLQPNDTLTDCLNGTLITYNGNENMLQNDMGNYELKNAKLPAGYIPMGMKEYQGILYLVLMNPITRHVQIGSYPSPKTDFGSESEAEEYTIQPIEIGTVDTLCEFMQDLYDHGNEIWKYKDSNNELQDVAKNNVEESYTPSIENTGIRTYVEQNMHEAVWRLIDSTEYSEYKTKMLRSKLDESLSSNVFTKDFDESSMLTLGDNYLLNKEYDKIKDAGGADVTEEYEKNPPFQSLKFFTLNEEKEKFDVDRDDLYFVEAEDINNDESKLNNVAWESNGWLGAQYEVEEIKPIDQNVSATIYTDNNTYAVTSISKKWDLEKKDYEYLFTLSGGNYENKILDLQDYVQNNTNVLTILEGPVPTLETISFIEGTEFEDFLEYPETTMWYTPVDFKSGGVKPYMLQTDVTKYKDVVAVCDDFNQCDKLISGFGEHDDFDISFAIVVKDCDFSTYDKQNHPWGIIIHPDAKVNAKDMEWDVSEPPVVWYYENQEEHIEIFGNSAKCIPYNENTKDVLESLVNGVTSEHYRIILRSSEELTKLGLHGKFRDRQYTLDDHDSVNALCSFIEGFNTTDHHIILPDAITPKRTWKGTYLSLNKPENFNEFDFNRFYFGDHIIDYQFPHINILTSWMSYGLTSAIPQLVKEGDLLRLSCKTSYDPSGGDRFRKAYIRTDDNDDVLLSGPDVATYVFLFSPIDLELVYHIWDRSTFTKSTISINTCNLYDPRNDNVYVVPENFDGEINGGTPILNYGDPDEKLWEDEFATYKKDTKNSPVPAKINIKIDNPSRVNISTKYSINGKSTYVDSTSGYSMYNYYTDSHNPDEVIVDSVPYKIQGNHILIYDNLKSSDTINYSSNEINSVTEYNYYIDNNIVHINITVSKIIKPYDTARSVLVYKEYDDMLIPIGVSVEHNCEENTWGDNISVDLTLDASDIHNNKFLFAKFWLDSDDVVILPIFTGMSKDKYNEFIENNISDFTKLYIDDLEGGETDIPADAVIHLEDSDKEKYLTVYAPEEEKTIVHESNLEYYWYNGIDILGNSTGTLSKNYYFGKGVRSQFKINLTKLGIKEGDIITITGIEDKNYEGLTVTVKNHDLFEKVGSNIYFKVDTLSRYNLQKYTVTIGGDESEICRRRYLIHHTTPPITHSEADLGWIDKPIGKHAGWEGVRGMEAKQLYVTKSDACNPNVQLNVVSATPESFSEKDQKFKRGSTLTNKSQVKAKIEEMTGGLDTTKQLFSLVRAELDTDAGGFTLPMPTMPYGAHDLQWTKNKKNKGCNDALVLTRESGGHAWKNQIKDAVAYTGVAGGIAALGAIIVLATLSAVGTTLGTMAGAVTAFAAVTASIPFAGWIVMAAALVAASIWMLCKLTAGEDQKFEFFTIKGPENQPLLIPMWGKHVGYKGKEDKGWHCGNVEKTWHPWYFDPDFHHAEELITFIATHVYYLESVGNASIKKNEQEQPEQPSVLEKNAFKVNIKLSSATTSSYELDRYNNILDRVYPSNNFNVFGPGNGRIFNYSGQEQQYTLDNNFDVTHQEIDIKNDKPYYYYYDSLVEDVHPEEWSEIIRNINSEFEKFIPNLGGEGRNVYYAGTETCTFRTQDQGAFGGNGGGRRCKFKCHRKGLGMYKMIDGDYPINNQGYVPVAYAVGSWSEDPVMVKDGVWGKAGSDWGTSKTRYRFGPGENETSTSSKYYDFIQWDTYSDAFKLTCNTNEI